MGSIHLLRGSDDVLREEALAGMIEELVDGGDRNLLVDEFAGAEVDLSAAVDAAQTRPFLTERRVVVVRHLGRFSNAEALAPLLAYVADPVDTTDLVLVWERGPEAGARQAGVPPTLTKALKAAGASIVDPEPPSRGRQTWVGERFRAHGLEADARARDRVVEQLGDSPGDVVELVERLVGVFGPGARLGVDEIEPFLGEAGGVPPWELTDAVDRGDAGVALEKLHRMLHGGSRHPLQILATLHGHYARMLRLDGAPVRGEKDAAAALGLKGSTFPARKALEQGRRLGHTGVARAVALLGQADLDLRGAQAWPEELVMEVLVARLAALTRR